MSTRTDTLIADSPRIQWWMHERSGLPIAQDFIGIAREVDGEIVAAFGYDYFQPTSCSIHLCVDGPAALNRSLLCSAFSVPFLQWKYNFLFCVIQADNVKSLNMAGRLGFQEVGVIPGALWFGVLYRNQCRWIPAESRT